MQHSNSRHVMGGICQLTLSMQTIVSMNDWMHSMQKLYHRESAAPVDWHSNALVLWSHRSAAALIIWRKADGPQRIERLCALHLLPVRVAGDVCQG